MVGILVNGALHPSFLWRSVLLCVLVVDFPRCLIDPVCAIDIDPRGKNLEALGEIRCR